MEINEIIGKNLAELRKKNEMTQREVAYKLDFSDKSVSKWESGESMPSIDVLCKLAQLYNVKLDYFVTEEHDSQEDVAEQTPPAPEPQTKPASRYRYSRLIISLLSILVVWVAAVCLFVFEQANIPTMWIAFVWAIPASLVLAIVFSSIWGKPVHLFIVISAFIWTILGAIFVHLVIYNVIFWQIFLIGAPLQIAVLLTAALTLKNRSHDPATIRAKREYIKEVGQKRREKQAHREEMRLKKEAKLKQKTTDKQPDEKPDESRQLSMDELNLNEQTTKTETMNAQTTFLKSKNKNIIQDLQP